MRKVFVFMLLSLFITSCSDDPVEVKPQHLTISGTVTDTAGNPLSDAVILLDLSYVEAAKAFTRLEFELAGPGPVSIVMMNYCRTEVFFSETRNREAGIHSVLIESVDAQGRQLTDQALRIRLTTSALEEETLVWLGRNLEGEDGDYSDWDYDSVVDHVRIQATTDAAGHYSLSYPCLGFGAEIPGFNGEGKSGLIGTIPWRVRPWAYHSNYATPASGAWVELDPETGGTADVVFP